MKLLVCISKTPDTTAKIAFTTDQKSFDAAGVNFIMNPYDEWYALVRAVELKEANGGVVTVITVGPQSDDTMIRKALAIGADEAVRVNKEAADAFDVAHQIANYAKDKEFDIILTGKETISFNSSETGAMLAELLDIPFISFAIDLQVEGDEVVVKREIEGGSEVIAVPTPFVLSASKGLAEQRIPNMRGIMMAKSKPLAVIDPIPVDTQVAIAQFATKSGRSECTYVDSENMEELVRLLHEEAKVI